MSLNRFDFIGHLGRDCSVNTVNGQQVGNITVAISKKINGEDYTQWVDASIWDKEKLYPYLKKGTLVYVSGEVSPYSYTKRDGTHAASLKVSVKVIHLLGGQKQNNEGQQQGSYSQPQQTQSNISTTNTGFDATVSDDDLPF